MTLPFGQILPEVPNVTKFILSILVLVIDRDWGSWRQVVLDALYEVAFSYLINESCGMTGRGNASQKVAFFLLFFLSLDLKYARNEAIEEKWLHDQVDVGLVGIQRLVDLQVLVRIRWYSTLLGRQVALSDVDKEELFLALGQASSFLRDFLDGESACLVAQSLDGGLEKAFHLFSV